MFFNISPSHGGGWFSGNRLSNEYSDLVPKETRGEILEILLSDADFQMNATELMQLRSCKRYEKFLKRLPDGQSVKLHVGMGHAIVKSYFYPDKFPALKVGFAVDMLGHGTAGLLRLLPATVENCIMLAMATDNDVDLNIPTMLRQHEASGSAMSILMEVEKFDEGDVVSLFFNAERPRNEKQIRFSNGIFIVSSSVVEFVERSTTLVDLVQIIRKAGMTVSGLETIPQLIN